MAEVTLLQYQAEASASLVVLPPAFSSVHIRNAATLRPPSCEMPSLHGEALGVRLHMEEGGQEHRGTRLQPRSHVGHEPSPAVR